MQEVENKLEQKRQAKFARRVLLERIQKNTDIKTTPVYVSLITLSFRVLLYRTRDTKSLCLEVEWTLLLTLKKLYFRNIRTFVLILTHGPRLLQAQIRVMMSFNLNLL